MLEKGLIVISLLGDIPTALSKQREGGLAVFFVHVSKSNLNNLERALKKLRLQLGFKYNPTSVQVLEFYGYSLND